MWCAVKKRVESRRPKRPRRPGPAGPICRAGASGPLPDAAGPALSVAGVHALWQAGEWELLARLDPEAVEASPGRDRLAGYVCCALSQLDDHDRAGQWARRALAWGCPPEALARALLAGVHNTLGRAASLAGSDAMAEQHFREATGLGPGEDSGKAAAQGRIRALRELGRLGLAGKALALVEQAPPDPVRGLAMYEAEMRELRRLIPADPHFFAVNPYVHNRFMAPVLNAALREFAAKSLGSAYSRQNIDYFALQICQCERLLSGRLATPIQDAVARLLVARTVAGPELAVLEIGALFGVSLAMLHTHCVNFFDRVRVACIDPFYGYYAEGKRDIITDIPVTERVFARNMARAGVPPEDYLLIKRLSTEPEAQAQAAEFPFNLLIIDGDHSYEGAQADFEGYLPLLAPGGLVIFDDYDAPEWPGVRQYVDEVVKAEAGVVFVGVFSRTAVFKKVGP